MASKQPQANRPKRASKKALQKAPPAYQRFVRRFPGLGKAWEQLGDAGAEAGPLDVKTQRLIKLALAIGSRQEGAQSA